MTINVSSSIDFCTIITYILTFEIFSLDDNYAYVPGLDNNYLEVVITQWDCSYHPALSFDV